MISNLLLIIGVAILSITLRSVRQPFISRLGTLGVLATSFLAGWLLGGSMCLGLALAASWVLLPWLEILTRVRTLRLPVERKLETRRPPNRSTFPSFGEMTEEIETAGFEHLRDLGWDFETNRHFYRVFNDGTRRIQASICLLEQDDIAFYYVTITSRRLTGEILTTWNYPFSYGLKLEPRIKINRFSGPGPFTQILQAHEDFLIEQKAALTDLANPSDEAIIETMQQEMSDQITHNIALGLLKLDGKNFFRYTVRGMLYLWFQFLRDFVRLS